MSEKPKRNFSISVLDDLTPEQISEFDAFYLYELQNWLADETATLKRRRTAFDGALDRRYEAKAALALKSAGKDSGTVRIDDGGMPVKCDARKNVDWDQEFLAARWKQIEAAGEDPSVYIKATYTVPEAVYGNFPPHYKVAFNPARTVKVGKPTFTIEKPKA